MVQKQCKVRTLLLLMSALTLLIYIVSYHHDYPTLEQRNEDRNSSLVKGSAIPHDDCRTLCGIAPDPINSSDNQSACLCEDENVMKDDIMCRNENDHSNSDTSLNGKPVYEKNKTVLFLSMPKCGTRTFVWTVFSLQQIHYFGPPVNVDYMLGNNKEDKMKNQLLSYMRGASPGAIVHGHYRYIPFYRPERKPVYMSMIRDPVGRFESFFYFMRHGDQDMSREQVLASLAKHRAGPDETLDDCVEKNRSDCSDFLNMNIYVTSFCGYRLKCSQDPEYAFKRAKRNIEKFLVVGLVEDYDLTLRVFEKLLPATFGEAANIYSDAKARFLARSKTSYKRTSKPSTYAVLKKRMKYDYMFYEYVKQRFYNVAGRLGLGPCAEPSRITHDPT